MRWGRRLQVAAVAVLIAAYAGFSHYSNSNPQARDLATLLALAPMLVLGLILIWRWNGVLLAGLAGVAALLLLRHYWALLLEEFSVVYLMQQCGFYGLMAWTFARSLFKDRIPLCTDFADRIHGPLSELELRYTRTVTWAWVWFFLANLAVTFILFAFAPLRSWSFFVNFISLPLVLLMFVAEFTVRRRVLPQVQRHGLIATVRIYFSSPPERR
jgi:uncharacterized membrane protein